MPRDERKRQKKLAEQAAKRKQRHLALKKAEAASPAGRSSSGTGQFLRAVDAPIHECLVPEGLFEAGMGTVMVSRRMASGQIAAGVFLLDVYCLGVKNAYAAVLSDDEYRYQVLKVSQNESLKRMDPACARKLVEGAEAYAQDLGFSPHRDYQLARRIFGDIDAGACRVHFEFGKDGKPFFMAGPYDTPQRSRQIIETLMRRSGPDGFHYMAPIEGSTVLALDDDEDDE